MLKTNLIKSVYSWLIEKNLTPYILVDTMCKNVEVPEYYIDLDKKILFNVSLDAIENHFWKKDVFYFCSTFVGERFSMVIPTVSIIDIYSFESKEGLYNLNSDCNVRVHEYVTDSTVQSINLHLIK